MPLGSLEGFKCYVEKGGGQTRAYLPALPKNIKPFAICDIYRILTAMDDRDYI